MKQNDERTKKTAAPADGAEAPEAPKPGETLSDAATDAVSGGGCRLLEHPEIKPPTVLKEDEELENPFDMFNYPQPL